MKVVLLVALLFVCGSSVTESASFLGNLASTLKIVGKLCYCPVNRNSQAVIDKFFGCYDQAPGKEHFVKCQNQLFGGPMNTVANVGVSCSQPAKIPAYGSCIQKEFSAAGQDMNAAVEVLNACQSAVLGIRS